ncbi:hypothetical protein OOJ09_18910 [Mesorhizobium qingshengii]|uniref:Uncharacterized protein n=1 Tax=Mesorhizobium qingshengii TaxID=1165689 RepID=A0ABT4QXZ4_9HYPH|nr:hypothetical protein [Mesorhizobium qingshengii]MCZ8546264.1 hypothetical protein [Mesorhizobium qingshengii]
MATIVAIAFDNGSVGRMQIFEPSDPSDEDVQAQVDANKETWEAIGIAASGWHRCQLGDFPTEHQDMRNAWSVLDGKIIVDMDKARDITRDRLRVERAPLLAAKDIEALQAIETGDQGKLAAVAADKQQLRDATKIAEIDEAKTPDELRAITLISE